MMLKVAAGSRRWRYLPVTLTRDSKKEGDALVMRVVATALTISAILLAVACGGQRQAARPTTAVLTSTTIYGDRANATPTTLTPTTTTVDQTPDGRFLAAFQQAAAQGMQTFPDVEPDPVATAHQNCGYFAMGDVPPVIRAQGWAPIANVVDGIEIVLAVRYICPQYQPILDAAMAGHNPLQTSFSDGTYRVGVDIKPGTYQAVDVSNCYWERLDANGHTIANDLVMSAPQVRVTVLSSDFGFHSEGCTKWTRIGS